MTCIDRVVIARGPHPIPSRTRSLSLSAPMVLCLKARESRSLPGLSKIYSNYKAFLHITKHPVHLVGVFYCARPSLILSQLRKGDGFLIFGSYIRTEKVGYAPRNRLYNYINSHLMLPMTLIFPLLIQPHLFSRRIAKG